MSLTSSYTFFGNGNWSLDATSGLATGGGTIEAIVPEGSDVDAAFLYSSTYFGSLVPDVTFSSGTATIDLETDDFVQFETVAAASLTAFRADVTEFVDGVVGDGADTPFEFTVSQIVGNVDGYVLAVVYSNPDEAERTIVLADGGSESSGDNFTISFDEPIDTTVEGFEALLSLGIGFGNQDNLTIQFSTVDVNGERLTSAAGGQDDRATDLNANGALITVGGIGDDPANPADPNAGPTGDPRFDDELYDLAQGAGDGAPFIANGDSSISVETLNPSNDDNIFFAGFNVLGQATIDNPEQREPPVARDDENEGFTTDEDTAFTTASVLDNDDDPDGDPISVVEIDGTPAVVGEQRTGSSGGLFSLNADGSVDYDPNGQFEDLNDGETATDTFTYTISDGDPETANDSATVTITIEGVTDMVDPPSPPPEVSISPATVSQPEGDSGSTAYEFMVSRTGEDLSEATTVSYAVTGSAGAPATADDFAGGVLPSGTVTIAAGATSAPLTIEVQGDTEVEDDESFAVSLSAPVNGEIVDGAVRGVIENDDQEEVDPLIPVRISFKSGDAGFANAFGIYDKSTMEASLLVPDVTATAEGAVLYEADLTQEELDNLGFFLLPDGASENADLASLVGEELMVENTADGYAVTAAGTPLVGAGAPAFFSDASLNPGGLDHFVEDGTPATYCLSVEDLVGGGDLDFDDAMFLVEAGVPMTGAEARVTFEGEHAGFRNTFGYFREDTGEAEIIFADLDETTLPVGTMETFDLDPDAYKQLKFFLIPDGATKNADLFADLDALDLMVEEVNGALQARDVASDTMLEGYVNPIYVPEKDGNPDATRHALQTGDVETFKLSWEDLPGGGDKDYNDTFIGVAITAADDMLT